MVTQASIELETQTPSLAAIRRRIANAEARFNRTPGSVILLAVSKTRTPAEILAVMSQGQRKFAENYLQEALPKIQAVAGYGLEWHFIGKVQSNKTEEIARYFDWVHTIERDKIAHRLNDQRPESLLGRQFLGPFRVLAFSRRAPIRRVLDGLFPRGRLTHGLARALSPGRALLPRRADGVDPARRTALRAPNEHPRRRPQDGALSGLSFGDR